MPVSAPEGKRPPARGRWARWHGEQSEQNARAPAKFGRSQPWATFHYIFLNIGKIADILNLYFHQIEMQVFVFEGIF
jgi:hypothetical protein